MEYVAYQDDVGKPSAGVHEAQAANIKMVHLFKEKGLTAHPDKTGYIVFGSEKYKEQVNEQLETCELTLGTFKVKRKVCDKYLGQILHTEGNRASIEATIKEREGRIKGAIFEVKGIIEDFQMQAIGGMMSAWELWEKAMVPSLLSGSGTWVGATKHEYEACDKIQDLFWRVMLEVPDSCPKIALRAETRMIGMKHRVWQHKLLLLRRIQKQSMETLSRQILNVQQANQWPGLAAEVKDICRELGIPDINGREVSDGEVKTAILEHHDRLLIEEVENSKKMRQHAQDNFKKVQDYLKGKSVDNCRMAFRIRCEMVKEVRGNFKDKYRRKGGEHALNCEDCNSNQVQTQTHCLVCPHWEKLRTDLDLSKMEGMVTYFQRLLTERLKGDSGS